MEARRQSVARPLARKDRSSWNERTDGQTPLVGACLHSIHRLAAGMTTAERAVAGANEAMSRRYTSHL